MVQHEADLDTVFKALGDPTRRAMLSRLTSGPMTVSRLAAPHAMSLAGASKHIRMLEQAGLVRCERRGRERLCHLNAAPLRAAEAWLGRYAAFWSERLDALESALRNRED